MTGYGKAVAEKNKFSVEAEIKSVNSRFIEVFLKIPFVLSTYEYELREIIKSKIQRGKISVIIHLKNYNAENVFSSLDKTRLKSYLSLLNEIKKSAKIKEDIKLDHLINNKDLLLTAGTDLKKNEFAVVKSVVIKAINELQTMKKKEGQELAKDLNKRIENIRKELALIEKEFRGSVEEYFAKLKERVKELLNTNEINEDRLNQELALIADRAEITEECVRLKSHLKFFKETLNNESEPGRKLNFLCQEINREVNTISSKSVSTTIIHSSVLIKEEIEKIREQVQNIG